MLATLILLTLFRLALLAVTNHRDLTYVLNLLPLLTVIAMWLFYGQKKSLSAWPSILKFLLLTLIYVSGYIVMKISVIGADSLLDVRSIFAVSFFILFPVALYFTFDEKSLNRLLKVVAIGIVILGFTFNMVEFVLIKLNFIRADEINYWLTLKEIHSPLRINTFLGQGAKSGIALLFSYSNILWSYFKIRRNEELGNLTFYKILLSLAVVALFLCDSLTVVFTTILLTFMICILNKDVFLHLNKMKSWTILLFTLLLMIVGSSITSIGDKFLAYFFRGEILRAASLYMPSLSNCQPLKVITGVSGDMSSGLNRACHPGEFHFLFFALNFGMMTTLGWYVMFFSPLYIFIKVGKKACHWPEFFYYLAFLLPVSHYSGVEIWGNNYLFGIVFVLILRKYHNPKYR